MFARLLCSLPFEAHIIILGEVLKLPFVKEIIHEFVKLVTLKIHL